MARERVIINGKDFGTTTAATEHFRAILARYQDSQPVNADDDADLRALLERHPEVVSKVGVGIGYFYVKTVDYGTRCFHVKRADGSSTDFSFYMCVKGRKPTPHQEFQRAARQAVQEDIRVAKVRYFEEHKSTDGTVPCALTGEPVRLDDAHLDHAEPLTFEVIVHTFMAQNDIRMPELHYTPSRDNQTIPRFVSSELAGQFRAYHKKVACLRWVSRRANLSVGGKHHLRHRKPGVTID